jgi:hypothetical protein
VSGNKARERIPLPTGDFASVAFSLDGKTMGSGGLNGEGHLWDLATSQPKEIERFKAQEFVAFTPDGKGLASDLGPNIQFWNLSSMKLTKGALLKTNYFARTVFAISPDANSIAAISASDFKTVKLWSRAESEFHDRPGLPPHPCVIQCMAFAPDGQVLATGGHDGKIRLWDVTTTPPKIQAEAAHKLLVTDLAFSRDGRTLASCSAEGKVRLWKVDGKTLLPQADLAGNGVHVRALALSPDDKKLASARDGQLLVWDVATGTKLVDWAAPGRMSKVLFAPDSRHFATVNGNGTIYIMRLPTAK